MIILLLKVGSKVDSRRKGFKKYGKVHLRRVGNVGMKLSNHLEELCMFRLFNEDTQPKWDGLVVNLGQRGP